MDGREVVGIELGPALAHAMDVVDRIGGSMAAHETDVRLGEGAGTELAELVRGEFVAVGCHGRFTPHTCAVTGDRSGDDGHQYAFVQMSLER